MTQEKILRGEIFILDFGDSKGHTISKIRPVVIIQNNLANTVSQTIIVSPITSNPKVAQLPVGVKLEPGLTGLNNTSYVNLGHIYTVDRNDLGRKIGLVTPSEMERINEAINMSLALR